MKIKILHIASDDLWGGAEAQIQLLIRGLNLSFSKEISCDLLTFNHGQLHTNLKQDCTTYLANEKTGLLKLIKDAIKIGKLAQPDIIVSHGYKEAIIGCVLSKVTSSKWIHQFHGSSEGYQGIKFIKAKIYGLLEKSLAKLFSNSIIVISKSTLHSLGLDKIKKARVIYNAANVPDVSISENLKGPYKIYLIGRLAPVKRVDLALDIIASCIKNRMLDSPIELHIIGDGSEMKSSIKKAEISGIRDSVFFHGFIKNPFQLIKDKNSLLILTSDSEGIPTVILEAMHLGIPIIARNVGGISEVKEQVKNYPLIIINNNQLNSFPQKLVSALNSIDDLNKAASDCDTQFFKVQRYLDEHFQMYQTLAI